MSDKSKVLLAIGVAIGLVCSIAVLYVLDWIEHTVTEWRNGRKQRPHSVQRKDFRTGPRVKESRYTELYMEIASMVFFLSSFLGAIAARNLLGW